MRPIPTDNSIHTHTQTHPHIKILSNLGICRCLSPVLCVIIILRFHSSHPKPNISLPLPCRRWYQVFIGSNKSHWNTFCATEIEVIIVWWVFGSYSSMLELFSIGFPEIDDFPPRKWMKQSQVRQSPQPEGMRWEESTLRSTFNGGCARPDRPNHQYG